MHVKRQVCVGEDLWDRLPRLVGEPEEGGVLAGWGGGEEDAVEGWWSVSEPPRLDENRRRNRQF